MSGEVGFLIGMAFSENDGDRAAFRRSLAELRAQVTRQESSAIYQEAFKEAAAKVHGAMMEELRLSAQGKLPVPRLSDPNNVDARNKAYAEFSADAVARLSGNEITMSRLSIETMRKKRGMA